MTEREISWRLKQIGVDCDNRIRLDAKLHGMEYRASSKKPEVAVKLSKEQEGKVNTVIEKAIQRKKAQYGNRS